MTLGNTLWHLSILVPFSALLWFILRGRSNGYDAIAQRTEWLRAQGVQQVWLLYSPDGVGVKAPRSVWSQLNTGFLAYIYHDELVIEFPWWHAMKVVCNVPSFPYPVLSTIRYKMQSYQAFTVNDRQYLTLAINVQDKADIKRYIRTKQYDQQALSSLMEALVNSSESEQATHIELPTINMRSSLTPARAVNGALLYVLLPCLLLAVAIAVWAVLTKQRGFR